MADRSSLRERLAVRLATKPSAVLQCSRVTAGPEAGRGRGAPVMLIVFLNGMMAAQEEWAETIVNVVKRRSTTHQTWPMMLTYDRYGQGRTTDRDPSDAGREVGKGHDFQDVVQDLGQLLAQVAPQDSSLLLVGNSIGVPVARLYAQTYPGTVAGLVALDTNMPSVDLGQLWPDPDNPDFDAMDLPPDVTPDVVHGVRRRFAAIFGPDVVNKEGVNRANLAKLLPSSHAPKLVGIGGKGPFVTVVGHDPVRFAEHSAGPPMHCPISLTRKYLQPLWERYNQGMLEITDRDRARGVITAKSGHFVQRDDPDLVAREICLMLDRLASEAEDLDVE